MSQASDIAAGVTTLTTNVSKLVSDETQRNTDIQTLITDFQNANPGTSTDPNLTSALTALQAQNTALTSLDTSVQASDAAIKAAIGEPTGTDGNSQVGADNGESSPAI